MLVAYGSIPIDTIPQRKVRPKYFHVPQTVFDRLPTPLQLSATLYMPDFILLLFKSMKGKSCSLRSP